MKHMKTIEVPKTTMQVVDKTVCDLCGLEIKPTKLFEVDEVTVKRRFGEAYPEGGHTTKVDFDICPSCFETKLKPWIVEQGGSAASVDECDW